MIAHPRPIKKAVIREDYFALTGDFKEAVVLGQLIYWSKRVRDFDLFLAEEQRRNPECNVALRHGWIIKTAQDLIDETMLGISRQSMRQILIKLVAAGWIEESNITDNPWDRSTKYRVDLLKLQEDLNDKGFALSDFTLPAKPQKTVMLNPQHSKVEFRLSRVESRPSKVESLTLINKDLDYTQRLHTETLSPQTPQADALEEEKNEREKKMLLIFSRIVLDGIELALFDERSKNLRRVMDGALGGSMELWEKVCENISRSKFLMGESRTSSFKASLDWVLEDHNAVRILEGAYGVGDRETKVSDSSDPAVLQTEIEALEEPLEIKAMRLKLLEKLGENAYASWFKTLVFEGVESSHVVFRAGSHFARDYLSKTFKDPMEQALRSLEVPIANIEIRA